MAVECTHERWFISVLGGDKLHCILRALWGLTVKPGGLQAGASRASHCIVPTPADFHGRGAAPPHALRDYPMQCLNPRRFLHQGPDGHIVDGASETLSTLRAQRSAAMQRLRAEMDQWARQLHAQGVSERAQVAAAARQCLASMLVNVMSTCVRIPGT